MKLNIELIPKRQWGKNCRTLLKQSQWDKIRKYMYEKKNYQCEICKGQGKKHPVECHEVWKYKGKTQKLVKLEVLCPTCHKVKHIGRIEFSRGYSKKAEKYYQKILKHFRKINKISKSKAQRKIQEAFIQNSYRSEIKYKVDIKLAKKLLKKI